MVIYVIALYFALIFLHFLPFFLSISCVYSLPFQEYSFHIITLVPLHSSSHSSRHTHGIQDNEEDFQLKVLDTSTTASVQLVVLNMLLQELQSLHPLLQARPEPGNSPHLTILGPSSADPRLYLTSPEEPSL